MSKTQLYDIMCQMKSLIEQNQQQARKILVQNPLLTRALFQAQIMLGMVQAPQAVQSIQPQAPQPSPPVQQANVPVAPSTTKQISFTDQTNVSQEQVPPRKQQQNQPSLLITSAPAQGIYTQYIPPQVVEHPRGPLNTQANQLPHPQSSQFPDMLPLPMHSGSQDSQSPPVHQPPMPPVPGHLQQPLQTTGISHHLLKPPFSSCCLRRQLGCLSTSSCYSTSSSDYMSKLVDTIHGSKTPDQALSYFNSVSLSIDVVKNRQAHSAIVHALSKAKWYLQARCLLKCLIKDLLKTCPPPRVCSLVYKDLNRVDESKSDCNVFGMLIIALSEMGLVDQAIWVYHKITKLPAIQACNALLNGLVKKGRFSSVWRIYEKMVDNGVVPNVVTYGTLINACCGEGDVGKSLDLFNEILRKEIKPTVVIFTTLIHGLCNEGRLAEGEDLFRAMKESDVVPNLYTYNVLIDGHCTIGNFGRVVELYREMRRCNLVPNVVTFGILVDGFCKDSRIANARSLFPYMLKVGVPPNVFVYNSIMDGLCKGGNLSKSLVIYSEMEKSSIPSDVFTYSILIKGLSEVGRVKEADELLLKMKNEGIAANSVMYNSLIVSHCKQGDMDKALELCSQMIEEGIEPNALTFSTLIHGYCRYGDMDAAKGIRSEMIIKGILPDVVTYTDLINGHFKNASMNDALGIYKEMQEEGIIPNAFTISCLVDGLCKDGRVNDAFKLFLKFTSPAHHEGTQHQFGMISNPFNHVAYTALIQGLCKEGRILRASKLFSDMRTHGIRADVVSYMTIFIGHSRAQHVQSLRMLQADMLKLGFLPDTVMYPILHKTYQEIGDFKSALKCFEALLDLGVMWSKQMLPQQRGLSLAIERNRCFVNMDL